MYALHDLEDLYGLLASGDFNNEKSHVIAKFNAKRIVALYCNPEETGVIGVDFGGRGKTRGYTSLEKVFQETAEFLFRDNVLASSIKSQYPKKW